jgi:hypothetical protein
MTTFAKAKDERGLLYYLMAETEEEIEVYCDNFLTTSIGEQLDLFKRESLSIVSWASDVTPAMAQSHFTWVGKNRNPFVVAKPFDYKNPEKSFQPFNGGKGG